MGEGGTLGDVEPLKQRLRHPTSMVSARDIAGGKECAQVVPVHKPSPVLGGNETPRQLFPVPDI